MKKALKYIVIMGGIGFLCALSYGLWFYFKPMKTASASKTDFTLTDEKLLSDFHASAEKASAQYNERVLEISGDLKKTEIQDNANNVIFDKGGETIIVATFIPAEKEKVKALQSGDRITVKGMFKGYIKGDEMFGTPAEIKIDECTLIN